MEKVYPSTDWGSVLPLSQWLPTLSWLPQSCPAGPGLQTGSRAGGCLLPPWPLLALGGLSEGGAASGGPLRTRVPDTLSGRAQPERPLCPAHWQPHKCCSHGSALGEVQTNPPCLPAPGRCPPSVQRSPSLNPSAVSTPLPPTSPSLIWCPIHFPLTSVTGISLCNYNTCVIFQIEFCETSHCSPGNSGISSILSLLTQRRKGGL